MSTTTITPPPPVSTTKVSPEVRATFTVPIRGKCPKPFKVRVRILSAVRAYNRTDMLITPMMGSGEAWVSDKFVELDDKVGIQTKK